MARYLVLIRTSACDTCKPELTTCAISVASNPAIALASLQEYSPIPCELIHTVESGSRTEYLERTLHIKYRAQRLHGFWFALSNDDIVFIQTLTAQNFSTIAGFLNKKELPPPQALSESIAQQLEICDTLLQEQTL